MQVKLAPCNWLKPSSKYFYWLFKDSTSFVDHSSQTQLLSLSHCSVYLVAGVGTKLSRPVYLAPHPHGYQSKIILLSLLILNYLNLMMYQL